MRCIPTDAAGITLGVDTHKDFHVAVALDDLGRRLGTLRVSPPHRPATKSSWTGRTGSVLWRASG
jgi:transposase